ncbi:trypsin-like peptidase domain-containing protein [Carboxylicivirga sp. N1Y90]|uniref:trypsin-like peptidase domain-containing protein n=1 Tax=Carboxylicivirga fragile TaxID=3417571 RepID=UPI003D357133|nr:trypsin-like peptidase domain-containing protein [Marinilabiliaceae bacterium N1Y90]
MLKKIIILPLFFIGFWSSAQVSHGGSPDFVNDNLQSIELSADLEPMAKAMREDELNKVGPLKFAQAIFVDYTPKNSGSWEIGLDGKMVWRLALKSAGAKSLNLIFDKFKLLEGAKLFVYNKEGSHILGSFTEENNKQSGLFAIAPVMGDEIIVELQSESYNAYDHELQISAVNHDYLGVFDYLKRFSDFNDSGDCNIDVNCDDGLSDEIKRSVCKMVVQIGHGSYLCSGTMVNNTEYDGKAYLATAGHCIDGDQTAQNIIFYFNFESPKCGVALAGTDAQTLSGADVRAYVENMDFALLEMSSMPPETYRPYWAGWDRTTNLSQNAFSVHHPSGDIKKVSVTKTIPIEEDFIFGGKFIADCHWEVAEWESGVTEGGSSGSGLFTQEDKLIGFLSGGEAYCGNPYNDYYARLNRAWDNHPEDTKQLAKWLDPAGTDVNDLVGFDFYEGNIQRISSLTDGLAPDTLYSNNFKGSWGGNNERNYSAFAHQFTEYSSATLHGVYVLPAKSKYNSDETINVKVWSSDNDEPTTILAEKNNITLKSMYSRETLIEFEDPLTINGSFFIGIELNNPSSVDTFSLYNVIESGAALPCNKAFIKDNGTWKAFSTLHPQDDYGAYWFDFLGSDMSLSTEVCSTDVESPGFTAISPNPVRNGYLKYQTNIEDLRSVEVYTVNGQLLINYTRDGEQKGELKLPANAGSGLYIVVFKGAVEQSTERMLLIR